MAGGAHYLELTQVPIVFDPIDQVESAFFDQSNFQMFCVQHGFTDVKVKGLSEEDNFKITIPARGPVSTIKFSAGNPRLLSIQRRKTSVEIVNIFAEGSSEKSLPIKPSNSDIVGFYWIFKNEYVVLITTSGVELYHCNPYRMGFKLTKSYSLSVSWAIFSPEELVLLVCSKGGNVIHPFLFKQGVSVPIIKFPKFEVDQASSIPSGTLRDSKTIVPLMERDVVILNLYKVQYVACIRNSSQASQSGAEVLIYQLNSESASRLTHILSIDISGRFTLSIVDNLVIVHHQAWKTSMLFDIAYGGETMPPGSAKKHQPVVGPLSIAPTKLDVRSRGKSRSSGSGGSLVNPRELQQQRSLSPSVSPSVTSSLSPSASPAVRELQQQRSISPSVTSSLPLRASPAVHQNRSIVPELYSPKWVFFQPNIIVDAQHGAIWWLGLNLEAVSNMMTDKCALLQFLLMRDGGKEVILSVCRECLEPGRQANLGVLGGMFDLMNHAYKMSLTPAAAEPEKKYKVVITQKDVYTKVFVPHSDRKDMLYKFLVAVLVEYVRSLHKLQITVEHFLFEMIMNILIENKCFYQLHQFLQYHVISDSKPLACLLLSRQLVYPPATQLAMDMFKRLSTADGEIIDILLSRGQILSALRYVKAMEKVDSVSARQFLEAAANEDDKILFYTVYKFFEERNVRLRRKAEFPQDEHCQPYEALYKKWFSQR